MLSVTDLDVGYGALPVLFGVDLSVADGETLALIGSNGAGKSTLFSAICGLLHPADGDITLDGQTLLDKSPAARVDLGIVMVPEGRRLFPSLTVEENLLLGAHRRRPGQWSLEKVYSVFPTLADFRTRASQALSGGQQQLVAIGRALMANPRILICDELSLGLSPAAVDIVYAGLRGVKAGMSIVLVEQDVTRALAESESYACIRHGEIVLRGRSQEADRTQIAHAYFGSVE